MRNSVSEVYGNNARLSHATAHLSKQELVRTLAAQQQQLRSKIAGENMQEFERNQLHVGYLFASPISIKDKNVGFS